MPALNPKTPFLIAWACLALLLALATSCGPANPPGSPATKSELIVSTAASAKELMEDLGRQFTARAQVAVKVNPGPSSGLANQIIAGAPADLFLSANQQWADAVKDKGLAVEQHRLLTNKLVLVVPTGNPAKVTGPQDLASPDVKKIAMAGEKVPAGMYGDQALTKLGLLAKLIETNKIARGQDVRSALSFVERKEAEAGIVYATDVAAASGVEIVHEFDPALHDEIVYAIVLVKRDPANPAAKEFLAFLLSPAATETYERYHFQRLP